MRAPPEAFFLLVLLEEACQDRRGILLLGRFTNEARPQGIADVALGDLLRDRRRRFATICSDSMRCARQPLA